MSRLNPGFWFSAGLALIAILVLFDFTILGKDFGTDSWKSQYPWADNYPTESVTSLNYDYILEQRPWLDFARTEMLAGRLPLWNPYSFTGAPLYANHLIPVLYPPLTIPLLLFESERVAGWVGVIHLAIFGIGLFRFLRRLGIDPWPAFIIASASQFTGACFVLWYVWAAAVAWMPWVLEAYEGYHHSREIKHIAYAGLSFGLMLMVGFPAILIHFIYLLVIYVLFREYQRADRTPRSILIFIGGTVLIGGLLSGIQNIPTAIYSRDTYRGVEYAHSSAYLDPLLPPDKMESEIAQNLSRASRTINAKGRLIAPTYRIRILGNRNFIGAFLLFLCLVGFFTMPRDRRIWIWLTSIFFIISFIDPVYDFLWKYLPLWKFRIYQPRENWQLACIVSAAYGLNALFRGNQAAMRASGKLFLTIAGVLLSGFLFIAAALNVSTVRELLPGSVSLAAFSGYVYAAVFLLFTIFMIACFWRNIPRLGITLAVLLPLVIIGGIAGRIHALPYCSDTPTLTPDQSEFTRELAKLCGQDGRIVRISSSKFYPNVRRRDKVPFLPNLGMLHRIRDVSGYDSLIMKRAVDYLNLLEEFSIRNLRIHMSYTDPDVMKRDLFRSLSVGCIISDMPEIPGCKKVRSFGSLHLHKPESKPVRYYLSGNTEIVESAASFIPKLMPDGWWDSGKVFIDGTGLGESEREKILAVSQSGLDAGTVVLTAETPTSLTFEVNPVSPALLVVNDAYAPGWNVYIDGRKTKCLNVNLLFRAAYIPRGEHIVRFAYEPAYMAWGWLSTILGIILFTWILILSKHRPN